MLESTGEPDGVSPRRAALSRWLAWGAILVVIRLLRDSYLEYATPPEEAYASPVLLWGALRHGPFPFLLLPAVLPLVRWRALRWRALPDARALRLIVGGACVVLAWQFSSYDYNLYFDRAHVVDRVLIVALAAGVLLHPALTPAFLAATVAVAFQFDYPLGSYTWTDKIVPFEVLLVFVVFLHLRLLRAEPSSTFVLLALAVTAAHYFFPAFYKLWQMWFLRDDLASMAASCYMNGWLAGLDEDLAQRLLELIRRFNPWMTAATLGIEGAALALLFWRRAYLLALPACILLHLVIFLTSGILFWMWIVFDVALWLALRRLARPTLDQVYGPGQRGVAIALALSVNLWLDPMRLTWFDTPLTYCFELEAIGASGRHYHVPRSMMRPYDVQFAQDRFAYLSEESVLVGTCGTTQDEVLARELARATPERVAALERDGRSFYDRRRCADFDRFLRGYFGAWNRRGLQRPSLGWAAVPPHIWVQSARADVYAGQERIDEIRVLRERRYWDGERFTLLSTDVLRSVTIVQEPALAATE